MRVFAYKLLIYCCFGAFSKDSLCFLFCLLSLIFCLTYLAGCILFDVSFLMFVVAEESEKESVALILTCSATTAAI